MPIRVLIAKPGLDGHDRGAIIIAKALRDAGMEVIYTGLRQTPEAIVSTVIQEDVQILGLSILSGAHSQLFKDILDLLVAENIDDLIIIAGGIIPSQDILYWEENGINKIFGPGTDTRDIIKYINTKLTNN